MLIHVLKVNVAIGGGVHVREIMGLGVVIVDLDIPLQSLRELPEHTALLSSIHALVVIQDYFQVLEQVLFALADHHRVLLSLKEVLNHVHVDLVPPLGQDLFCLFAGFIG